MSSSNRFIGVAIVFVVAVVAAIVVGAVIDDDGQPRSAPEPSPSASATVEDPQATEPSTDTSGESPEGVARAEVERASAVARKLVVAYTEYSYTDESQNAWMGRARPFVTDGLYDTWAEAFGGEGSSAAWQRITDARREARTEVISAELSDWFEATATELTFTVRYTTDIRDEDTDGWTSGATVGKWVTVVKQDDAWRVSTVRSTSNRQHDQT